MAAGTCRPTLLQWVSKVYQQVIEAVPNEAREVRGIRTVYAPVDTIGCVEIVRAEWLPNPDEPGTLSFHAHYGVRPPGVQSIKGTEDVMVALCRQLVGARYKVEQREAEQKQDQATAAQSFAERDEGFFRNIWYLISGERQLRQDAARTRAEDAVQAAERVQGAHRDRRRPGPAPAQRAGPSVVTAAYLNTRGRERHRDYQFVGPAPPTSWWRAYADHTTFERPTVLVQSDGTGWQAYLSGIPSRRRDAVGTVIRYTVVAEGVADGEAEPPLRWCRGRVLGTGDVLALVANWLADQEPGTRSRGGCRPSWTPHSRSRTSSG